jgi:hypothetical protein
MEESKGHLFWAAYTEAGGELTTNIEFYVRDGEVFRAPMSNAIMPDGYRVGRWECKKELFDKYKDMLLASYDKVF